MTLARGSLVAAALVALAGAALIASPPPQVRAVERKTLPYASRDGTDLLLDLYLPQGAGGRVPVIVFLHGGGWSGGTRTTGPDFTRFFSQDGFAVASLEYRLTPGITFPGNAEDVKTAIRWLRANRTAYGLDAERICLWGTSAGGHLAAIAGLTPRGMFEGTDNLAESSAVQCVLDAYGPTSFAVMDAQTEQEKATLQPVAAALAQAPPMRGGVVVEGPARGATPAPAGRGDASGVAAMPPARVPAITHDAATSAESKLVGAPIQTVPDKVRIASPLTYVTSSAPPFLIMHGLADTSVPHHQSVLLYEALAAAGADVTLRLVDGLPHTFFNRTNLDELAGPFRMDVRAHPRGGKEQVSVERAGVFDVARRFFVAHLRAGG